jgi:hypothetical protein
MRDGKPDETKRTQAHSVHIEAAIYVLSTHLGLGCRDIGGA